MADDRLFALKKHNLGEVIVILETLVTKVQELSGKVEQMQQDHTGTITSTKVAILEKIVYGTLLLSVGQGLGLVMYLLLHKPI